MKKLTFMAFLFCSFLMYGQQNELLNRILELDKSRDQLKYVLDLKVDSIPEDGFSKLLKIKLNSDLDNLGDIFAFYVDGKELELSKKEQTILEERVRYMASWFVKSQQYALVKSSGGIAPVTGIDIDKIQDKKVVVLLMGGSCITTERDNRREHIYKLFNNKVRSQFLLSGTTSMKIFRFLTQMIL